MATGDNKGKSTSDQEEVAKDSATIGITNEQLNRIITANMEATKVLSEAISKAVAKAVVEEAVAKLEIHAEKTAKAAVEASVIGKERLGSMKTYGITLGISVGVFVVGTLAIMGYNNYSNRNVITV